MTPAEAAALAARTLERIEVETWGGSAPRTLDADRERVESDRELLQEATWVIDTYGPLTTSGKFATYVAAIARGNLRRTARLYGVTP